MTKKQFGALCSKALLLGLFQIGIAIKSNYGATQAWDMWTAVAFLGALVLGYLMPALASLVITVVPALKKFVLGEKFVEGFWAMKTHDGRGKVVRRGVLKYHFRPWTLELNVAGFHVGQDGERIQSNSDHTLLTDDGHMYVNVFKHDPGGRHQERSGVAVGRFTGNTPYETFKAQLHVDEEVFSQSGNLIASETISALKKEAKSALPKRDWRDLYMERFDSLARA